MGEPLDSRLAQEAMPQPSDAWFRSVVEAANEGIWIIDLDARTIFANERMARMLGTSPGELIGRSPLEFLDEADRAHGAEVMARNFEGHSVEFEIRFRRADGNDIPVLGGSSPLRDGEGRITGSVATFSDLTARHISERERDEQRSEFQTLADNIPTLCWMAYADGHIYWYNRRWYEYTGTSPESQEGWGWESVHDPDVLPLVAERWQHSLATGETFEMTFPLRAASGEFQPFLTRVVPIRGEDGKIRRWFGTNTNIDALARAQEAVRTSEMELAQQVAELKVAQQREHLLAREVDHRAKNLLAVVQSVVQLSRAGSVEELKDGLTGRIQALARAHSLLADSRWEGVELTQLAQEELAPFMEGDTKRIHWAGPPVLLRPSAAQSLALVLHELITNAAKYGALSKPGGSLELDWRIDDATLILDWVEAGGGKVDPPAETGFGSRLISTSIDRQLRGRVDRQWTDDGLHCTLRIPAEHAVVSD
ncbi:MAG TPA: PAS domain S-box protein [Sphingomicrobium sp.]